MENASKALLIAGAILIVIVLISVGMLIVNSTQDMTERAGTTASSQAIQVFNQQFTQYEGTQKGSTVKSLIQAINASNGAEYTAGGSTAGAGHQITITYTLTGVSGTAGAADIVNTRKYKITFDTDSEGYINAATITGPQS